MPRAEAGSIKHLSNRMKSKGLQRLRWYCQPCEKQCRDENGYKCHVMSESHMRAMQSVTEDARKHIANYSHDFKRDFLQLLRTAHGEKPVHMNQFYQEYIRDKDHIHMNATQWSSLTEFAKYLGREGICRVSEEEKGIYIAWIDNSPEALKRKEYVRKKEAEKWGDEQLANKLLREQERRAKKEAKEFGAPQEESRLERKEGEIIRFSLGPKPAPAAEASGKDTPSKSPTDSPQSAPKSPKAEPPPPPPPVKISLSAAAPPSKPVNAFAAAKKANAFMRAKKGAAAAAAAREDDDDEPAPAQQTKKMSNMERIMQEEMERGKRKRDGWSAGGGNKKMRVMS